MMVSDSLPRLKSLKLNGVRNMDDGCPVRSSVKRESLSRQEGFLTSFREQKRTETRRHLCPPRESALELAAPMMSMSFDKKRKLTKHPGEAMPTKYVKISNARPGRKIPNSRCPGKVLCKGTVNCNRRSTCGFVKTIAAASFNVVATRCRECSPQKGYYAYESSNNLPSERFTGQNCVASKMEHESSLASNTCKSDSESDVAVSGLDEENNCSSPQPSSASAHGWTPAIDLELSPEKALRAEMLKKRFADTILKAKQKTLFDHVIKVDPINSRQEKEKLERQQQEEKARIQDQIRAAKVASSLKAQEELRLRREREREAARIALQKEKEKLERQEKARIQDQIRAAKVASSLKAQEELRLRREREREAARIALQKMEKTVEIEDNMKVLTELEIILFKARQGDRFGNIMERIGLSLKNDYMDYEDEEDGLEEGEICD